VRFGSHAPIASHKFGKTLISTDICHFGRN